MRRISTKHKILFISIIFGILGFILLLSVEVLTHFYYPVASQYYIHVPNRTRILKPAEGTMRGVTGETVFRANKDGVRGEEYDPDASYQMAFIGGSTTICLFLSQEETWPELTGKRLRDIFPSESIWLGNAGKSGSSTRHHILQMDWALKRFPELDTIVMLVGINDVLEFLKPDDAFVPLTPEQMQNDPEVVHNAFYVRPDKNLIWYKKTGLWTFMKLVKQHIVDSGYTIDNQGSHYIEWRRYRHEASGYRDQLPEMGPGLEEYERNLRHLFAMARANGVRLIVMTQPTMWNSDLPEEIQQDLWMGGIKNFQKGPGFEYYTIDALDRAMDQFNEVLRRVAADENVECIDLEAALAQDGSVFYDDCHFHEAGNRMVSDIVVNHFEETGLYR